MNKSRLGLIILLIGLSFSIGRGIERYYCYYQYDKTVNNFWHLSERASTISQKSEYMDKFVNAYEKQHLEGLNSSLIFQTPSGDFNENLKALKSLQKRLKDISTMDESSFAYQTAIQQITAQEQGEASGVLDEMSSCWERGNWYDLWNPIIFWVFLIIQVTLIVVGIIYIINDNN